MNVAQRAFVVWGQSVGNMHWPQEVSRCVDAEDSRGGCRQRRRSLVAISLSRRKASSDRTSRRSSTLIERRRNARKDREADLCEICGQSLQQPACWQPHPISMTCDFSASLQYSLQYLLSFSGGQSHAGCAHFPAFSSAMRVTSLLMLPLKLLGGIVKLC